MLVKISLERLLAESSRLQDHRQRNCVIRSMIVKSAVLSGHHVKTNVDVYARSSPIGLPEYMLTDPSERCSATKTLGYRLQVSPVSRSRFSPTPADSVLSRRQPTYTG